MSAAWFVLVLAVVATSAFLWFVIAGWLFSDERIHRWALRATWRHERRVGRTTLDFPSWRAEYEPQLREWEPTR